MGTNGTEYLIILFIIILLYCPTYFHIFILPKTNKAVKVFAIVFAINKAFPDLKITTKTIFNKIVKIPNIKLETEYNFIFHSPLARELLRPSNKFEITKNITNPCIPGLYSVPNPITIKANGINTIVPITE